MKTDTIKGLVHVCESNKGGGADKDAQRARGGKSGFVLTFVGGMEPAGGPKRNQCKCPGK